jgi:hypothetical protein
MTEDFDYSDALDPFSAAGDEFAQTPASLRNFDSLFTPPNSNNHAFAGKVGTLPHSSTAAPHLHSMHYAHRASPSLNFMYDSTPMLPDDIWLQSSYPSSTSDSPWSNFKSPVQSEMWKRFLLWSAAEDQRIQWHPKAVKAETPSTDRTRSSCIIETPQYAQSSTTKPRHNKKIPSPGVQRIQGLVSVTAEGQKRELYLLTSDEVDDAFRTNKKESLWKKVTELVAIRNSENASCQQIPLITAAITGLRRERKANLSVDKMHGFAQLVAAAQSYAQLNDSVAVKENNTASEGYKHAYVLKLLHPWAKDLHLKSNTPHYIKSLKCIVDNKERHLTLVGKTP